MEHNESTPQPAGDHDPDGPADLEPGTGPWSPELIGKAVAAELAAAAGAMLSQVVNLLPQVLPQLVAQGVAQALQQVPVRTRRLCAKCLTARVSWEAAHEAEMRTAIAAAMTAAGVTSQHDPRAAQLDIGAYLPDHLRPGSGTPHQMPQVLDAVTMAGGDDVCPAHLPGAPQHAGRRPFLIAGAGLTAAAAARMANGSARGMPGMP